MASVFIGGDCREELLPISLLEASALPVLPERLLSVVLGDVVVPGEVVSDGLVCDCGRTGEVCAVVVELLLSDGVVVVVVVVVVVSDGLPVVVGCGAVRVLCAVVLEVELSVVDCAYT